MEPASEDRRPPKQAVTSRLASTKVLTSSMLSDKYRLIPIKHEIERSIFRPGDRVTLVAFPTDILFGLHKALGRITSACLGLTCKMLYAIHKAVYGKVSLHGGDEFFGGGIPLHQLLQSWMPPQLQYSIFVRKFITWEREIKLQAAWDKWMNAPAS